MSNDHLSLDELAELDEGLLPPERTSAARAHLHGCEACQSRVGALESTRRLLAELPAESMPPAVVGRLWDALAALRRDATGTAAPDETDIEAASVPPRTGSSRDIVPEPGRVVRPRFGRPTLAASAVAAALVLIVGAIVYAHFSHTSNTHESAGASTANRASAPTGGVVQSQASGNFTQSSTGRTYTPTNLASNVQGLIARVPAPLASPQSTVPTATAGLGTTDDTGSGAGSVAGGSTGAGGGQTTKHDSAKSSATNTLGTASPRGLPAQPVPKALRSLARSKAKILACAATLTGEAKTVPLAVDFGRWNNPPAVRHAPAAVFVFRAVNPANIAVYVTPPTCNGTIDQFINIPLAR